MQYDELMLEKGYKIYETIDGSTEIYDPYGRFSGEVFFDDPENKVSNSSR